ncbi:MAG: hybrid sensor histidine kinase/response regulator [Proteobacteria bacterium SG_bin9]|nr:MAG: hybrid sensor histidine kinase/response regulator [Proteobacteria bacterium SG_bin9]
MKDEQATALVTLPVSDTDRKLALAVVLVSTLLFCIAVPFAKVPLAPAPAFVAFYQSALAVNDIITAVLLYTQFRILGSRGLLLLASGYLFTAATALVHAMTFPGLLAPTGLFGAGSQTTVWLYMLWHAGFPLLVLGYVMAGQGRIANHVPPWRSILRSIFGVGAAVAIATFLVTQTHDMLPVLLRQGRYTPAMIGVVSSVWLLSVAALVALWRRKPRSTLDVWLMVTMCAWLFDIALSAVLNAARFDLGFYAGRIYGLCAATFVLIILLVQTGALQTQLSRLLESIRQQAEVEREHHRERERLFSAAVESSNDAIITKTLDGVITGWNPAAERLFGYPASEAIGRHINLIVPVDRHVEVTRILDRIRRGETIEHHETLRIHRDGRLVEVSLSISPIRSRSGDIVGASKIAHDITEARGAQRALSQEIEERHRIFETSQDLILVTDGYGTFVQVSPSSKSILGYEAEEMVGRSAVDFIFYEDLDNTREEMRAARRGRLMRNFMTRYVHRDGRVVQLGWMGTWSEPVKRHFFIGRDLTEKLAAEALVRQSQKMDAVGQLTGGIAHDFNNILTAITGTIEILAAAVADRPELAAITTLIDDAATRGSELTKHLLAFARKQPLQPREVEVNALIVDTTRLLRPTLGERIEIRSILADEVWQALVDPNQLTTAILNLAINARDAMPKGGKLTIRTSNVSRDAHHAMWTGEMTPGDYVMIVVEDTGTGIPAAILDRVFEPFFTTKEVGKGTGLGLSMVYGFVKQSNGHIKIESMVGKGTSISLYLPRAAATTMVQAPGLAATPIVGERRHETILIVEDDAMVRDTVTTQIQSLGYLTCTARDALQALAILGSDTAVDLLFTDLIMPGPMNGRELASEALKLRPSLKVLFTSGYTEDTIIHHGRLDPGVLLLAKPYRKLELAQMIEQALTRASASALAASGS